MKNIPRIYIDTEIAPGKTIPLPPDTAHYLTRVMRTDECIAFGRGREFTAKVITEQINKKITNYSLLITDSTNRPDPVGDITLAFAPIKKSDDLVNMATQLGVKNLQPVITEHTTAKNINWERMKKIAIEASEQSNRNSVPEILPAVSFSDFVKNNSNIIFADERFAYRDPEPEIRDTNSGLVLVGPEGGFSDAEFAALDNSGAIGICLGKTILRAELAAAIAIEKLLISDC